MAPLRPVLEALPLTPLRFFLHVVAEKACSASDGPLSSK